MHIKKMKVPPITDLSHNVVTETNLQCPAVLHNTAEKCALVKIRKFRIKLLGSV